MLWSYRDGLVSMVLTNKNTDALFQCPEHTAGTERPSGQAPPGTGLGFLRRQRPESHGSPSRSFSKSMTRGSSFPSLSPLEYLNSTVINFSLRGECVAHHEVLLLSCTISRVAEIRRHKIQSEEQATTCPIALLGEKRLWFSRDCSQPSLCISCELATGFISIPSQLPVSRRVLILLFRHGKSLDYKTTKKFLVETRQLQICHRKVTMMLSLSLSRDHTCLQTQTGVGQPTRQEPVAAVSCLMN